ncbi:ribbon-helix-helix protein, CopG family [Aquabacterium sp.]|uniref:ribbon-helix-helix protein, CopG family n=1 Tax=Aquabacterium sp. TaxID=1872578 RepID=UPI00345B5100
MRTLSCVANAARLFVAVESAQITLTLPPGLLQRVDARARELGISRTALIKFAVSKALENKVA